MSDNSFSIKTPDPLMVAQWAGQLRAVMPLVGGIVGTLGVTLPTLDESQLSAYISAAMILFGAASYAWAAYWSWRQKIAAEKASKVLQNAAAVASAEHTAKATVAASREVLVPVTVTVTPEGQDNEAVKVSRSEAAAAPSVPINVTPSLASVA